MKRTLLSLLTLIILPIGLSSASVEISAVVDKVSLTINDSVLLEIKAQGDVSGISNPEMPQLRDFMVQSLGRSQSISIINGKISSSFVFKYSLSPKSPGKFTIPPAKINAGGTIFSSSPIDIEVFASGQNPTINNAQSSNGNTPVEQSQKLFVEAKTDKKTVFVNEQVQFTFRFFRRINLLSNPNYIPPSFAGFWAQDTSPRNYTAAINGITYSASEIRTFLFPTKPGHIEVESAVLQCRVEDFDQSDPFDDSFFRGFFSQGKVTTLKTNTIGIQVRELPSAGKPAGFSGAVGNFEISAEFDKKSAKVNEPVTLTVTILGIGNIKTIPEPTFPAIRGFKKYETVSSLNIEASETSVKGSKIFKTILTPETPGKKEFSGLRFSYFDPSLGEYITKSPPTLSIDISHGEQPLHQNAGTIQPSPEIKLIEKDIRYIKKIGKIRNYPDISPHLKSVFWAFFLPIIPIFSVFLYSKNRDRIGADSNLSRKIEASRTARRFLRKAKELKKSSSAQEYYNALSKALFNYVAHKLNVSPDGLTISFIENAFKKREVSAEYTVLLKNILEECDFVRFSPAKVSNEMMEQSFIKVSQLIDYLERVYK